MLHFPLCTRYQGNSSTSRFSPGRSKEAGFTFFFFFFFFCLFSGLIFKSRVLCMAGWLQTHCVSEDGLELWVHLLLPPKCWNKCVLLGEGSRVYIDEACFQVMINLSLPSAGMRLVSLCLALTEPFLSFQVRPIWLGGGLCSE